MITQKTIIEIATTVDEGIIEGAPNRTLESAILIMGRKKFRRLPITKLGKIRGVLTVTDIIRAISTKGLPEAFDETISDWMTSNPRTMLSDTTVIEASRIMSNEDFGSILVIEHEDPEMLSGIVTERDILRFYRDDDWENLKLSDLPKDLLTKGLITVNYKESLEDAIKVMHTSRTQRVLNVDDNGKLVGILSANDITTLCSKEREEINENPNFLRSLTTHFAGSKDIITTTMNTSLKDAVEVMCDNNIGSLPILDNDKIVGVLTERTIVHLIAKQ